MYRLLGLSRRASAALVLGLGLATAAPAQPAPDLAGRLDRVADRVADRLDLTTDQRTELDALAARGGDATPADVWAVTADLHALLTPEQRTALTERRARGERGARQHRRGHADPGARAALSDAERPARRAERQAQREATRPIREAARAERQRLREQLQRGALSDDAYADAVQALRDRMEAQLRAAATPEQRARLDARSARREAAQAARTQVLGLTEAQEKRLQTLRLDRVRSAPERGLDVRPYLDADGRLDRRALRQARRADRQAAKALRDDVLTERQRELLAVHRVLTGRSGRGHRGRRHGLRGPGRG